MPSKSASAKKPTSGDQIDSTSDKSINDKSINDKSIKDSGVSPEETTAAVAPVAQDTMTQDTVKQSPVGPVGEAAPVVVAEAPPEAPIPAPSPVKTLAVAANDSAPARLASPMMGQRPGMPQNGGSRPPGGGMQGGRVMPPPRPMAKAEQFAEGDHVVYPTHGVGKVERIATEEIAGHKLELIHITFEENRMTLRVPVSKARSAGLRKLASRKMFDEALAVLKGRARIKRTMWSRRAQEYEAKINSGDPLAIAEVVRDLHRNAGQPDQSFSERQIYEAAMDRLAAELGALERIDKAAASMKLAEFLKTV